MIVEPWAHCGAFDDLLEILIKADIDPDVAADMICDAIDESRALCEWVKTLDNPLTGELWPEFVQ